VSFASIWYVVGSLIQQRFWRHIMTRRSSTVLGLLLIFLGAQAFVYRAVLPIFGLETGNGRLWPLLIANIGLLLIVGPFLARQQRGLGGMFIVGIPIAVTSSLLLLTSITNWWGIWENLWPLIIIAFALGFMVAAAWMRQVWLLVPAMIMGVNGLVFLFCAITDLWEIWAAIWPIELLIVGLSLLLVNFWVQSNGLAKAGTILTIISGFGFALMALVLAGWVSVIAALILVGSGTVLIGRNGLRLAGGEPEADKEKLVEGYSSEDILHMKESV
jgi:hypothetical protein